MTPALNNNLPHQTMRRVANIMEKRAEAEIAKVENGPQGTAKQKVQRMDVAVNQLNAAIIFLSDVSRVVKF